MKVLLLTFDFIDWNNSKQWSYISSYLIYHELINTSKFEEVNLQIIPYTYSSNQIENVIDSIQKKVMYDLCIIWLPHANFNKNTINKIRRLAEHINFFLIESLIYTNDEVDLLPHLGNRLKYVESLLYSKASITCLCLDSHNILRKRGHNSFHICGISPKTVFDTAARIGSNSNEVMFAATIYNDNRASIQRKILDIIKEKNHTNREIIDDAILIKEFENSFQSLLRLDLDQQGSINLRSVVCSRIADLRRDIWLCYMKNFETVNLTISLPSYFKGYPGRVLESLLCHVPVWMPKSNLSSESIDVVKGVSGIYITSDLDFPIGILSSAVVHDEAFHTAFPCASDYVYSFIKSNHKPKKDSNIISKIIKLLLRIKNL